MHKIHLDSFEGPIDLLLYFIRRDELDIYDIPIAKITKEFIETIEEWKKFHLHVAGDFIDMASTLMRIKAKLLLPRKELNEEGEIFDPRSELVMQLIDYKRFKNAAEILKDLSENKNQKFSRNIENIFFDSDEKNQENMVLDITLFDLAKVFKAAMDSRPVISNYELNRQSINLEDQKEFIFKYFDGEGKVKFSTILNKLNSRMEIVVTFLAVLDLIREGNCKVIQSQIFGEFELQKIILE